MEMLIIKVDSREYHYMWGWLANHPINAEVDEPMVAENGGEVWQYMGSYRQDNKTIHEFRHRNHPKTNDRLNIKVNASRNMTDDDIEKTIPVK